MLLDPKECLELARIIAKQLEDSGLVAQIEPVLVSQQTAARLLEVCPRTIRTLRARGVLATVFVGEQPRIPMSSIRNLASGQTNNYLSFTPSTR